MQVRNYYLNIALLNHVKTQFATHELAIFDFFSSIQARKQILLHYLALLKDPNSKFPQIRFVKKVQDGYIFELTS